MSRTAQTKTSGHAPAARILRRVREDATDLALLATAVPSEAWKYAGEKNGTRLYELTGEALPRCISTVHTFGAGGGGHASELYMVRAVATLDASIAELLGFLRTNSTPDYQEVMQQLFGKLLDTGVTLDKLTCTTPPAAAQDPESESGEWRSFTEDDAYSANWLTLRSLTKLGTLDTTHDFTMMCYQDIFERQPDHSVERLGMLVGREIERREQIRIRTRVGSASGSAPPRSLLGIHTFSSMIFSDIPELPKSSKTERLHFRNSGFVVETTNDPDAVRVSLFLSLMPTREILKSVTASPRMRAAQSKGSSLAKKYQRWLQALAASLGNLAEAEKPGVTLQRLTRMAWVESDHCFICLKTFRALAMRRCHHCRFCGEAVCGSCSGFINMSAFDVSYVTRSDTERSGSGSGSGRSSAEETETRGCLTCLAELRMNLSPTASKRGGF